LEHSDLIEKIKDHVISLENKEKALSNHKKHEINEEITKEIL